MDALALTAADIVAALHQHYRSGWLAFAELRVGTGYGKDAEMRLDARQARRAPARVRAR